MKMIENIESISQKKPILKQSGDQHSVCSSLDFDKTNDSQKGKVSFSLSKKFKDTIIEEAIGNDIQQGSSSDVSVYEDILSTPTMKRR